MASFGVQEKAGLRLVAMNEDGSVKAVPVTSHTCRKGADDVLAVNCETEYGQFQLLFKEDAMTVTLQPMQGAAPVKWALEFTAIKTDDLPFKKISAKAISATHRGYDYDVRLLEGNFKSADASFANWHIIPENNTVVLSGVLD